jgi:hypothetical protein
LNAGRSDPFRVGLGRDGQSWSFPLQRLETHRPSTRTRRGGRQLGAPRPDASLNGPLRPAVIGYGDPSYTLKRSAELRLQPSLGCGGIATDPHPRSRIGPSLDQGLFLSAAPFLSRDGFERRQNVVDSRVEQVGIDLAETDDSLSVSHEERSRAQLISLAIDAIEPRDGPSRARTFRARVVRADPPWHRIVLPLRSRLKSSDMSIPTKKISRLRALHNAGTSNPCSSCSQTYRRNRKFFALDRMEGIGLTEFRGREDSRAIPAARQLPPALDRLLLPDPLRDARCLVEGVSCSRQLRSYFRMYLIAGELQPAW